MAASTPVDASAPPQERLARIFKAPQHVEMNGRSIFLAGSIEMGKAEDWQTALTNKLAHLPITIMNPRRVAWDGDWVQDISNPHFKEQVDWELDCQDRADVIALFFHPDTKAPISLLELGLYAASKKMVVCCPEGFYRRGNVQIVCARYGLDLVETLDQLAERVIAKLTAGR
ncbi:hypothetical protein C8J57DRAFT_1327100 [Mycena rebaudengoi]|nr:hypothetical protein C8J57DRAFT_1327100 [Mycena rebaudengoi]